MPGARERVGRRLPIVRAGAARGSRHAVLLVAESLDGSLARTTVSVGDGGGRRPIPARLPRLRAALLVVGGLAWWLSALGFEAFRSGPAT